MVQIIPLVGAAALFAQTTFGAAVPVRRTSHESENSYHNNQYNYGSNNHEVNIHQQYNNYGSHETTTAVHEMVTPQNQFMAHETTQQFVHETQVAQNMHQTTTAEFVHETQLAQENMMHDTTTEVFVHETQFAQENMMHETTTAVFVHETQLAQENMMHDTTTIEHLTQTPVQENQHEVTQTYVAQQEVHTTSSYGWPQYGSGSNSWNNGYNNCVQQCMAQFGAPPATMTEQALPPPPVGTGAVHTVLVAPEGAGLRYVPFAVNASIGDTIRYVWSTPNNHTATLSSSLAICNRSGLAEQRNFVSGIKNGASGPQVFDVVVQTEEPQFFYCSVGQHCERGMFGIVNPKNNVGAPNTVGTTIRSVMDSNPQLQAAWEYMSQNITGTTAENWGMGFSLDGIPEDQYEEVVANVLFTQANFAANPGMLESGQGAHNPDGSPVQIVSGLNVLLSQNTAAAPDTPVASVSIPEPEPTRSLTPVNAYNGALSSRGASAWLAVIVGVAGWMLI